MYTGERIFDLRLDPTPHRDVLSWPLSEGVLSKGEYSKVKGPLSWALDLMETKGIDRVLRHENVLEIFRTFLAIEKTRDPNLTASIGETILLLLIPPTDTPQTSDRKVRLLEILISNQKQNLMRHFPNRKANYDFIRALENKTYQLCDIIRQGFEKESTENFINGLKRPILYWLQQQTLPTTAPSSPLRPSL